MPELDPRDINLINPIITDFDQQNGLLEYVSEFASSDNPSDRKQGELDAVEALTAATLILRKEKQLRKFIHTCGALLVDDSISYDSSVYHDAALYACASSTDPKAMEQLDIVIRHFGTSLPTFNELYPARQTVKYPAITAKKKPARESIKVHLDGMPDGHVPITRKDMPVRSDDDVIPKYLESFLNFAIRNNGFKVADLKHMSGLKTHFGDYENIKKLFPKLKIEVSQHFAKNGVDITWSVTGNTKGRRYLLSKPYVEPAVEPVVEVVVPVVTGIVRTHIIRRVVLDEVVTPVVEETQPTHRQLAKAILQLINFTLEEIEAEGGKMLKKLFIQNMVAKSDGHISTQEAAVAVQNLLANSILHNAGNQKGMSIISSTQQEPAMKATQKNVAPATERKYELTSEDRQPTETILRTLANSLHRKPGFTVKTLIAETGLPKETISPLINQLAAKNLLAREVRKRQGGARSRAKKSMFVSFEDQQSWETFKSNPATILDELFA